jgi:hypothetical protein
MHLSKSREQYAHIQIGKEADTLNPRTSIPLPKVQTRRPYWGLKLYTHMAWPIGRGVLTSPSVTGSGIECPDQAPVSESAEIIEAKNFSDGRQ